jgi:hypothetical protein
MQAFEQAVARFTISDFQFPMSNGGHRAKRAAASGVELRIGYWSQG